MKNKLLNLILTTMLLSIGAFKVDAQSITSGGNNSYFLCKEGTVQGVGANHSGQLGNGTTIDSRIPVQVIGLTGIKAVAAGYAHSLYLKNDGTVWSSGSNNYGQLGDGTNDNKNAPVQVLGLTEIIKIACGDNHSLFLKNDGTVWSVGDNSGGQLGDGTTVNRNVPVQVIGLTGITNVSAGMFHSLFLKNDGTPWATGGNYYGQVGANAPLYGANSPVKVDGLTEITAVAAGGTHSLFLKSNGTVWGQGSNSQGELGIAKLGYYINIPVQVAGLTEITAMSGGYRYSLFLKNTDTVWAIGNNINGQLGDGTTVSKSIPFAIPGLTGVSEIAAGKFHSIFTKSDETQTVGLNVSGQLGDGTTINKNSPVQPTGLCNNLGTEENFIENTVTVYPNPCSDKLFLQLSEVYDYTNTVAEIFNLKGQLLQSIALQKQNTIIQLNHLPTGIYLIHIKTPKGKIEKKIVKN